MEDKKFDEAEFQAGVQIEHEHQPTYDKLVKYFEENGSLPPAEFLFEGIATDHVTEHDKYYNDEIGLPNMEKELTEVESNGQDEQIGKMLDEGMEEDAIVSKILKEQ